MSEEKEYDVTFGKVNPQVETIRIAMQFDRAELSIEEAEILFCGSQLSANLSVDKNAEGDGKGQQVAIETDYSVDVVGISKSWTSHPKFFSTGITMPYSDEIAQMLLHLRYRKGKILCRRTGNAPEKEGTDSGEEPTLYEDPDGQGES